MQTPKNKKELIAYVVEAIEGLRVLVKNLDEISELKVFNLELRYRKKYFTEDTVLKPYQNAGTIEALWDVLSRLCFTVRERLAAEYHEARKANQESRQCDCCADDRFKIIGKARNDMLKRTNIEDSKAEMLCLDDFLFRAWQLGWLKKYEETEE